MPAPKKPTKSARTRAKSVKVVKSLPRNVTKDAGVVKGGGVKDHSI